MQAAKFSQDRYYTNTHYAKVGGLPAQELKALELEFLARIFYTLWADTDIIGMFCVTLIEPYSNKSCFQQKYSAVIVS
jgi:hypothetical protein